MNTDELIAQLSNESNGVKPAMPSPRRLWLVSLGLSLLYCAGLVWLLGIRSDLAAFTAQPLYIIELWLTVAILGSSLWAAICLVYPDQAGQAFMPALPYLLFAILMALLAMQVEQIDPHAFMQEMSAHLMCFSCLAASTLLPSILLMALTQRGATTAPIQSGAYIVLAAVSIGALALRLHEPSNDMVHILLSHYAPMLLFAGVGAMIGKCMLKW